MVEYSQAKNKSKNLISGGEPYSCRIISAETPCLQLNNCREACGRCSLSALQRKRGTIMQQRKTEKTKMQHPVQAAFPAEYELNLSDYFYYTR